MLNNEYIKKTVSNYNFIQEALGLDSTKINDLYFHHEIFIDGKRITPEEDFDCLNPRKHIVTINNKNYIVLWDKYNKPINLDKIIKKMKIQFKEEAEYIFCINISGNIHSRVISKSDSIGSSFDLYKFIVNKTEDHRFYLARSTKKQIEICTPHEELICSFKKKIKK